MSAGDSLLVFLPVLGAWIAQAPFMRFDLLPGLRRPIDGGRTWRGRRIFGDNKTWRGAAVMFAGALAAALLLWLWPWWRHHLPGPVRDAGPLALGAIVGAGVVLSELPNSFVKRQLHIAPGARRLRGAGLALVIVDQADFVIGICLLLLPVWSIPLAHAALAFAAVVVVHLAVNLIGYAIGAREQPI